MSVVEIENIGPVSHLSIPVPESGGVVVLKARNGRGKSRALAAVEAAVTGRGKLDVKDGRKSGTVSAFGVVLKVGRSTRRSGELEVESIEGKLSVADLVDPGIKSPEAADSKRIKALTQLSGAECSIDQFWPLLGDKGSFESVVHRSSMESDDLVDLAAKIKRDIEAEARKLESEAEQVKGRGEGLLAAAADVEWDESLPESIDPLQDAFESAINSVRELERQAENHDSINRQIAESTARIDNAKQVWSGETVEAQSALVANAATKRIALEERQQKLYDEMQAAHRKHQEVTRELEQHAVLEGNLSAILERTQEHFELIDELESELRDSVNVEKPTEEQLSAAHALVNQARDAMSQFETKRKAKRDREAAQECKLEYLELLRKVKRLREAAKGTDDVLSELVAQSGCELRVEAGRLVCDTVRGSTYYSDLSAGERWKIAIDIAVGAVGNRGVLTIPQEAWEGLDTINRQTIAAHAVERGVVILTAECSVADEVTPEVYSPEYAGTKQGAV